MFFIVSENFNLSFKKTVCIPILKNIRKLFLIHAVFFSYIVNISLIYNEKFQIDTRHFLKLKSFLKFEIFANLYVLFQFGIFLEIRGHF